MPIPLLAAGSVALPLVGDAMNMSIQAGQNKKARKWATKENEKAYQRQIDLYNMQNEYNSPKSQMQRYQDAGLNPNLIYGQGTPGNTAVSTPKYEPAPGKYGLPQMEFEMIDRYQNYEINKRNMDLQDKAIELKDKEIKIKGFIEVMKGIEAGLAPAKADYLLKELGFKQSLWPYQLQIQQEKVNKLKADIRNAGAQADLNEAQLKKLNNWLDTMDQTGLDMNRVPWWLLPVLKSPGMRKPLKALLNYFMGGDNERGEIISGTMSGFSD